MVLNTHHLYIEMGFPCKYSGVPLFLLSTEHTKKNELEKRNETVEFLELWRWIVVNEWVEIGIQLD